MRQAIRRQTPERRLVRAVPGDVADQREDGPVVALDDVVEVAAQHRLVPPGPVARDHLDAVVAHQRLGQQAALEPGVLGGPRLGLRRGARTDSSARLRSTA